MANEKTPVVWDDTTKKHRPLGTGEKMGGLDASSLLSSDSGNLLEAGSDGLAYLSGSGIVDPRADNLLEESDRGKLQVTVDRIAEWLDGHPQDAALLADAINVVSGDAGNVIVEGTDKGAFLSKGAIAAAVAGMTDAQKAQLADAIAARIASDIADGKTIVASGGKLTSDPTNATAAQKKAINQALADTSAGFSVDNSSGKLKVDFSQMPTDEFVKLMSEMIDAQTISTANGGNQFYVDGTNGSDSSPETRGAPNKPFKTIQGCVNFITKVYKFAGVSSYINCKNINSTSSLTLPNFDRTTASITIRAASFDSSTNRSNPTVLNDYSIKISVSPTTATGAVIVRGSSSWNLKNFDVSIDDSNLSVSNGHHAALYTMDYSTVYIERCKFSMTRSSAKPWQVNLTTGEYVIYSQNYSYIHIGPHVYVIGSDLATVPVTLSGEHAGTYNRRLFGICASGSSTVQLEDTRDLSGSGGEDKRLVLSGVFNCLVVSYSKFARNLAYMGTVNVSGVSAADRKFYVTSGGLVSVADSGLLDAEHNDNSSTDTFLGANGTNPDGTDRNSYVSTKTYSWYD